MSNHTIITLISIISVLGLTFGVLSFILSTICFIKTLAMEKSTHTVQMVPIDPEIDKANEEYVKNWASSDEAIKKEEKLYKEELNDTMPEFSISKEDAEIFSL